MRLSTRTALAAFVPVLACVLPLAAQPVPDPASPRPIGVRMAEAAMRPGGMARPAWDPASGTLLLALWRAGERTGDPRYAAYVRESMERLVRPDGSIPSLPADGVSLDRLGAAALLFPLHDRTGDARWRRAAERLREEMLDLPQTPEGGLAADGRRPGEVWLDATGPAVAFLARYGREVEPPSLDDAARQLLLVTRHQRDPRTGLLAHGWDERRAQPWADTATGASRTVWGRGMGAYLVALAEVLDDLPRDHPEHAELARLFRDGAAAAARVQDPVTGMWFAVLDQPARHGNALETSGSAMIAYALAKGVRQGHLDASFGHVARRGVEGIVRQQVEDAGGWLVLNGSVRGPGRGGAGLGDGSFPRYAAAPVVADDPLAMGAFILAALEVGR